MDQINHAHSLIASNGICTTSIPCDECFIYIALGGVGGCRTTNALKLARDYISVHGHENLTEPIFPAIF